MSEKDVILTSVDVQMDFCDIPNIKRNTNRDVMAILGHMSHNIGSIVNTADPSDFLQSDEFAFEYEENQEALQILRNHHVLDSELSLKSKLQKMVHEKLDEVVIPQ